MKLLRGIGLLGLWALSTAAVAQTCPEGNPLVAPDNRYSVTEPLVGQRVVTDLVTGLMWKGCSEGQVGAGCTGTATTHTWTQALTLADGSTHAGFSDWRLPNREELRSLVETGCFGPSINAVAFPATVSSVYWSSTTVASDSPFAWVVIFGVGNLNNLPKSNEYQVRLVRGGQSLDPFNAAGDFTPDAFSFAPQTGVPLSDLRTSASISVSGIDTVVGIGVSGAADSAYSINGGPFVSTPGAVSNGDSVVVRHTSAAVPLASVTTTLQVGALTADFVSTTAAPPSFTIGGMVTGLAGSGLVLQNNGDDDLPIAANGDFTFATPLVDGSEYAVTVSAQPSGPSQTCSVTNDTATLAGSNVTDVQVACATHTYVVTTSTSNGTITSTINPVVSHGETTTVTGEANANHYFASVSGCGGTPQGNSDASISGFSYETGPITAACTVETNFARIATDLQIAKDSGAAVALDGQVLVYSITVANAGPLPAIGAQLIDTLPAELVDGEWACLPDESSTACPSPPNNAGEGDLFALIDLPVDGFLRYDLSARVQAGSGATVSNTASVAPPDGLDELDTSNNSATAEVLIVPQGIFANGFEALPLPLTVPGATKAQREASGR